MWNLLTLRPGGFPWLQVAGKLLTGWIVIDLDATLITAHSAKAGAAVTFKKGFGFHPLAAWCANTSESLAMLLRPGNAGSNTVADHLKVLAAAIDQLPPARRAKLLNRIDGAGATHDLLKHLDGLNTTRRRVYYTLGWTITDADETAIAALPTAAWSPGLHQDGEVQPDVAVAELTGLSRRAGWPKAQRLIVRRTRPAGRQNQTHPAGTPNRLALRHRGHEHRPHPRPRRHPPSAMARRATPCPRQRRGPRPHQQGHRAPPATLQTLDSQPRLGADRQPHLRPGRLDPATRPTRPTRPRPRRTRHPPLPPVAPTRPTVPPRPPPLAEHRQHLALARGIHHLLAPPLPATRTHPTGTPPATISTGRRTTTPEPGNPAPPHRHATTPPSTKDRQTGQPESLTQQRLPLKNRG